MRKLAVVLLALTILVTGSGLVSASPRWHPFKDSEEMPWAEGYLAKMKVKGYLIGDPDGKFRPNAAVKRVEAVVAAVRLMGLEDEARAVSRAELTFRDAEHIQRKYWWAVGYLAVAMQRNIIPGGNQQEFRSDAEASRLWVAELLVKAMGLEAEAQARMDAVVDFKDARDIPADKIGYMVVAVEKGIIAGYDDRTVRPHRAVKRGELSALLDRSDDALPPRNRFEVRGTVVGVVYAEVYRSITLELPGPLEERTYPVSAEALVIVNGAPAGLADVKPGYKAQLLLNTAGTAILVDARKAAGEERLTSWEGVVLSLELEGVKYGLLTAPMHMPDLDRMKHRGKQKLDREIEESIRGKPPWAAGRVLLLVPESQEVDKALADNLGRAVKVFGRVIPESNIYMRPAIGVKKVEPVDWR